MTSTAPDVPTYIAEAPADRQPALKKLRALCHKHLAGFTERIAYGMPAYLRDAECYVGFASQKQYLSVYVPPKVMAQFHGALGSASCGKSCIRYSNVKKIDFATLEKMLIRTAAMPSVAKKSKVDQAVTRSAAPPRDRAARRDRPADTTPPSSRRKKTQR